MPGPLDTVGKLLFSGRAKRPEPKAPHNPWQGYSALFNAEREKTPAEVEADRQQIRNYYREKVLRAGPDTSQ